MNLLDINIDWAQVGIVIGIFAGLSVLLTALILIVAKICKVDTDEKISAILSNLAGANCGGCGCTGCEGFAKKLCSGDGNLSDCHVTATENKKTIAKILGQELKEEEPTVAVVKCSGGLNATNAFLYCGLNDCANEASLYEGSKVCKSGCLGGGSCVANCPEKAISLHNKKAEVNSDACISCGKCIETCPKHLFERIPVSAKVYVACSSHCKGKEVVNACTKGCISCGMCVKNCPEGAITMVNNLPVIDYSVCSGCKTCVAKCPRKCILERT